jgi:uncharacterized membrane protein (UPF0136 family)
MKKTVWTFGLLSGAVSSAMMAIAAPFWQRIGFDRGEIIGYTTMVASFLLVFFGIRSYRERMGGTLGFWRGVKVGILITAISCLCYVATWQIVSRTIATDFIDQYQAHLMDKARADGATQAELDAKAEEMRQFKKLYANPFVNVAFTFLEPFPVGLAMTLISAGILRRKPATAAMSPARA